MYINNLTEKKNKKYVELEFFIKARFFCMQSKNTSRNWKIVKSLILKGQQN